MMKHLGVKASLEVRYALYTRTLRDLTPGRAVIRVVVWSI